MGFSGYDIGPFYDEMFETPGNPGPGTRLLCRKIESLAPGEVARRQSAAEKALFDGGITFSVYGRQDGAEKIWPFDIIPRIVETEEWQTIEKGLKQRIAALNLFIDGVYHDRKIIGDKVVPSELIESAEGYLRPCIGMNPPKGIWCHVTGTDLVRDEKGRVSLANAPGSGDG